MLGYVTWYKNETIVRLMDCGKNLVEGEIIELWWRYIE